MGGLGWSKTLFKSFIKEITKNKWGGGGGGVGWGKKNVLNSIFKNSISFFRGEW